MKERVRDEKLVVMIYIMQYSNVLCTADLIISDSYRLVYST